MHHALRKLSFMAIAALLVAMAAGCVRDNMEGTCDTGGKWIRLDFTTRQMQVTKADPHTSGESAESMFNTLQIWAFNSGSGQTPVGYRELSASDMSSIIDAYGNVSVIMELNKSALASDMKIDLYIAANASGVGLTMDGSSSRNFLESATFSEPYFGTGFLTGEVGEEGLPISRVVRDIDISPFVSVAPNPARSIDISLVRAVSKLHFFFAKPTGLTGATIQRIVVNGNNIPVTEYFFPEAVSLSSAASDPAVARIEASDGYLPDGFTRIPSASDIYDNDDPEALAIGDDEDVEAWVGRLRDAGLNDFGLTYLRESDRPITGTIYYTTGQTGSDILEAPFDLAAGDFVRNHEWIIYAYFSKGRLYVRPIVADWVDGGLFDYTWSYTSTLINQTGEDATRIINVDGEDYLMSAYGLDASGLPYTAKLRLDAVSARTTHATMRLLLDNPDFGFVIDSNGIMSEIQDQIDIELKDTTTSVTFYVVPKTLFDFAGSNPQNPVASLRLYLISEKLSSMKIPFNTLSLPGDQESIMYYYVTPDQYK